MAEDLVDRLESHMGRQDITVLLRDCRAAAVQLRQQAASLAAKDAEIKRLTRPRDDLRQLYQNCDHLCDLAERALAEAVEVMRPFAAWIDAVDAFPTASFPDHASIEIGHETGDPQPTKITGAHLRAARAFVAQHGSDSREGK